MDKRFRTTLPYVLALTTVLTVVTAVFPYSWLLPLWRWTYLLPVLYAFTVANNSYQVLTHVLTALKFVGIPLPFMVPGGAEDNQTVLNFTFHNQLDLWGWVALFLYEGTASWWMSALAAGHMATGLYCMYEPDIFQAYYIRTNRDTATLRVSKVAFVVADAVTRTYVILKLVGLMG